MHGRKKETVRARNLREKAQTVAPIVVEKAQETVSYKVVGGNARSKYCLRLNSKTGQVTVKKNAGKGIYEIKVKVTVEGTVEYKPASKTVIVTVKVK